MSAGNGSVFEDQRARGVFDPWAVLGLQPSNIEITAAAIRLHVRKVVILHVFERGVTPADTTGPNVPTWSQVNEAKGMMEKDEDVLRLRAKWWGISMQTWNPFVKPGDPRALLPPPNDRGKYHMQSHGESSQTDIARSPRRLRHRQRSPDWQQGDWQQGDWHHRPPKIHRQQTDR